MRKLAKTLSIVLIMSMLSAQSVLAAASTPVVEISGEGNYTFGGAKEGSAEFVVAVTAGGTSSDPMEATVTDYVDYEHNGSDRVIGLYLNGKTDAKITIAGKNAAGNSIDLRNNEEDDEGSSTDGIFAINAERVDVTLKGNLHVSTENETQQITGIELLQYCETSKIKVGNITAESTNRNSETDVIAISAASGTVEAGNLKVISNSTVSDPEEDPVATGIYVETPDGKVKISAGDISVKASCASGLAEGICIENQDDAYEVDITTGKIEIEAAGNRAQGVVVSNEKGINKVTVKGSVTGADDGIYTDVMGSGKNTITVDGDVIAKKYGLEVGGSTGTSEITVTGVIHGDTKSIYLDYDSYIGNLSITAYGLETGEGGTLCANDTVLENVTYIIKDRKGDYRNMTFESADTIEVNGKTYYTAKQGTVKVTVAKGYTLSSTQAISGEDNVYTVTIPVGGCVTLEAILEAVEEAEERAAFTGTEGNPVMNGTWLRDPAGQWFYHANGCFKNTWGYISNPYAVNEAERCGWFYFDGYGIMATGWKEIGGKWYYFNEDHTRGTYGMMLADTITPDGKRVGADGARIDS